MKVIDFLKTNKKCFSFEFFPPKNDEDVAHLLETAASLRVLNPAFISVTWGAGGSTRGKTIDIVSSIKHKLNVETMAHLTCVGASRSDIDSVLKEIHEKKIENVLCLRGDPPKGESEFVPHPDGFCYANEMIAHVRRMGFDFCLAAAAYPEKHLESPDPETDLVNLKRKVDAGADFLITQLFFDDADYFRFVDKARATGISVPIIPGIMPITNVNQVKRFTTMCGASIPQNLLERLESVQEDAEAVLQMGIDHATRQCQELLRQGAPGIHFYTLNRCRSTMGILKNIQGA